VCGVKTRALLVLAACASATGMTSWADTAPGLSYQNDPGLRKLQEPVSVTASASPLYTEDRITLQFMTGAAFSPVGIGPSDHPDFNYNLNELRLGWMLNTPDPDGGIFAGNVEALIALSGGAVIESFGSFLVGPTALLRYNFVQPGWKIVPYVQGGAGFIYSDASEDDKEQDAIGQEIEFTPQASVGFRYLLTDNLSVDAEFIYHHISNASMSSRNDGINALGGLVGVSYFFDKIWQ
jgi:hypothetical protein